jgi:hypothetical protein
VVERNNFLASEPVGIPIELQLTLKVVDDPADHSCAEALATGRPACLTPKLDQASRKKASDGVRQLNATSG